MTNDERKTLMWLRNNLLMLQDQRRNALKEMCHSKGAAAKFWREEAEDLYKAIVETNERIQKLAKG